MGTQVHAPDAVDFSKPVDRYRKKRERAAGVVVGATKS